MNGMFFNLDEEQKNAFTGWPDKMECVYGMWKRILGIDV